jgi:hypothetical protein
MLTHLAEKLDSLAHRRELIAEQITQTPATQLSKAMYEAPLC